MIKILENKDNDIIYECDCGVKGKCMIKPLEDSGTIVVDVRCPVCLDVERVILAQYKEEEKDDKQDNLDMSWSTILSNEVIEYYLNKIDED